jgi:hypothetical protein
MIGGEDFCPPQVENGHYSASLDAIVAFANVLRVVPAELLKGIS